MYDLLVASGKYSVAWLKKESLRFHPDRVSCVNKSENHWKINLLTTAQFLQKCDPDYRPELREKATQMFQIYQELMDELK